MAASESQKKASSKYINDKLDEIKLRVPKGNKELIKEIAKKKGESMNEYINSLINEAIMRDSQ